MPATFLENIFNEMINWIAKKVTADVYRIVDSSGRQRIFHGSNVVCIYLDLGFFENFLDTNLKTYHMSALPPRCTRPPRSFRSRRSLMLATVLVRRMRTSWPVWVTTPSGKGKCTLQKHDN